MGSGLLSILLTVLAFAGYPQVRRPDSVVPHAATLEGQVHDPSGTVLPNFAIVATRQGSGEQSGAISNTQGEFRIEGMLPGTYDVLIRRDGYSEVRMANVVLAPDGPQ